MNDFQFLLPDGSYRTTDQERFSAAYQTGAVPIEATPIVDLMAPDGSLVSMHHSEAAPLIREQGYKLSTSPRPLRFASPDGMVGEVKLGFETEAFRRGGSLIPAEVSLDKPVVPQVKTEAPSEPESPFYSWLGPAPKNPQGLDGWDEYQKVLARNKEARMGFWRALVPGFESIPFVGTVSNLLKSRSIVETAKRLRDKKPVGDQDLMDLNLYLAKQQEVGDASWGGKVGRVIRDSLTFAAEFKIALVPFLFGASKIAPKLALNLAQRATQGALAGSRVAGKASKYLANPASNKALYQMLSADQFIAQVWRPAAKDFAKGIFGAELGKFGILAKGAKTTAAQKAAGVLAEMSAFALPNAAVRVGSQLAASTAAGGEPATFRGNQEILSRVLQGDNPDETVAFWQGVGSEFIEAYTEAMGRYLTKGFTAGKNGIGKLTKDAGSSLGKAIDRMLAPAIAGANKSGAGTATLDLLSNKAKALSGFMTHMLDKAKVGGVSVSHVRKVFTDMGYDGVLEEMLEERAADFFNGLMGWTSYDRRAGEENDDMAIVRAFKNMWPTLEQLSVEAAAFSAPIGVSYLAPIAANPAAFIREAKNASELNMAAGLQTAHLQGKSEQDLEKFEKAARARVLDPGKRQETGEVPAIRQALKHRLQQEKFFEEAGERDGKIARAFNVLLEKLFSARYHPTEGIVLDPEVGFLATMSAPVVQYAKLGAKRYEEREKAAGKTPTAEQLEEAAINSGTRALLSLGNTIWAYNRLKEEGREKDGLTDEELPFYLDAEEAKIATYFRIVRRSHETGLNYLFPPDSARAAEIESFLKSGLADLDPATGLKALRGMVEKASGHTADKVKSELENARAAWETLMKKLETVGPAEAQQLANQGILYGTEFDLGNENAPGNQLQTALFRLPLNPESQDPETLKDPKKWTQASLLAKLFNSKEPMTPAEFDAAAALIGVDALYTGRTWQELRDEDFSIVPRIMAAAGSGALVNKGDDLIDSNGVIRTVLRRGNEKNRAVAYYETADPKSPGIIPLSEIGLGRTWSVHRRQETDRDQLGLFFADNTNRFVGTAQEIARQIRALGREVAAFADEKSALKALSPYLSDGTAVRLVGRKRADGQQLFGLNKAALAMRHGAISIVPARLAGFQGRSLAEDVVESVVRGLTRTFDKETGRFEWNSEAFRGQFGSLHDAIENIHAALAKKKAEGKDWSHREEQVFSTLMRFGKSEAMDVEIVSNFLINYSLSYENMDRPQVAQTYRMFRMLEPFRDSLRGALVDLEAGARGIMGDALFEALRFKAGAEAAKRGAATAKKELTAEDAIKRGKARVAEQADRLIGAVAAEEQRRRDEEDAAQARAKADLEAKLAAQREEQEKKELEEKARRDAEEAARRKKETDLQRKAREAKESREAKKAAKEAAKAEKARIAAEEKAAADTKAKAEEEARKKAEAPAPQITKQGSPVQADMYNSVGPGLSMKTENALPLQRGYAYRTVAKEEVAHLVETGYLVPNPALAGQSKRSRGQTRQKMFSELAPGQEEAYIGTRNIVLRVPRNLVPAEDALGRAVSEDDIEVLSFDGKTWVVERPSEFTERVVVTPKDSGADIRNLFDELDKGPNAALATEFRMAAAQPVAREVVGDDDGVFGAPRSDLAPAFDSEEIAPTAALTAEEVKAAVDDVMSNRPRLYRQLFALNDVGSTTFAPYLTKPKLAAAMVNLVASVLGTSYDKAGQIIRGLKNDDRFLQAGRTDVETTKELDALQEEQARADKITFVAATQAQQENEDDGSGARGLGASNEATMSERNRDMLAAATIIVEAVLGRGTADMASVGAEIRRTLEADGVQTESGVLPPWYETLSDFRRHVAADNARRDEILDNFNRARKTDLAEAGRILFMELVKALPYRQSALLFSAVQNTYGRSVLSFSPDLSDPVRFEAVVAAKDGEVRRVERPTREELLEELRNEAKAGIIEPMSDADMEAAIEEVGGGLVWRESNSAAGFVTRARAEAVAERLRAPWLFSEQGKQLRSHVLELVKYVKDQQGPGGFWGSGTLAPKGATKAQVARAAELSAKEGGLFKGEKALADSEIRLGYVLNEAEHPKAPDWKKAFAQHFAETVSLVLRGEIDQDFVDQFKTQAGFNGGERVRNAAYHLWLQLLLPMYGSLEAFEAGNTEEAIESLTGLMEGEDGATGALRKALGIAPGSRFGEIAISAESSKQLYGNPEQPLAKLIELFDATDVKLSGLRTATGLAGGKAYPGWTVATPLARAIEKVLRTDPLFAGGKMAQVAAGKLSRDEAESLGASDLSYDGIMRVLERALRKTWNDFHAEVRGLPSPRPGSIFLPVLLTGDKSQVLGTLIPVEAYTDLFGTPMGEYASFEEFREAVYGAPGGRPGLARAFERAVLDAATEGGIAALDPKGAKDRDGRFKRLKDAFKRLSQIGTPSIPPLLNVEGALRTDADGLLTYVVPLGADGKALKGPGDGLMWLRKKFAKAGRISYSAAVLQGMMKVGYWGPIGKALRQIKGALTEAPGKDTDGMPALHLADWSGNETPLTPGALSDLLDSAEFDAEAPNAAILLTGNVLKLGDPVYEKTFEVKGQKFGIFRAPALGVVSPMPTDAEARRFRASAQAWAGLLAPVANAANPGIASKYAKIVMDEIVLGAAGRVYAAAKRSALDYFVGMADRHSAQAAWAEDLAEEGVDLSSPTGFPYSRSVYFAAFARRIAQTSVDSGFYKAVLSLNSASAALSDGKLAPATNAPIEYGPDGSLRVRGRGELPVLTDSLRRPGSGRSPMPRGAARLTIHPDKPVPAGLKRALGRPDMKDTEKERNLEAMNLARHLQEEFGLDEKGFRSTLRILQNFQQPFRDDSDFIPLDGSTPFGETKEDALRFIAYLQARQLLPDLADVDPEDGSPRIEYGKAKISDYSADGVLKEDLGWHYEEDASGNKKIIGVTVPGIVFLGDRNPHVGSVQSGRPMRLSRNLARASAYIHQGIMAQVGSDEDGDWQHVFVARPQALIALHRIDEQLPDDIFGKQSTASPDRFSDSWSKEERDSWVERLLPVDADLITDPRVVRASRYANMFSDSAIGRAATALTALNLVYSRLRMPEIKGFRKTTDGDPLYLVRLTLAYDMTQRIVDGAKVPELMMGIGLHEELVPLFMAAIAGYEIPDTDLTGLDLYRHAHAHTVQKFTAYLNDDRKGRQIKKLVVEDGLKLEKAFLAVYGRQLGKNDANGWKLYGLSSIADQLSAVALGVRVPYKFRPHTTLDVLRTHNNLKVLMESEGQEGQPPAIDQFPADHPYRTFAERVLAPVYEKLSAEVSAIEATLASHPAYALPLERHVGEGLFEAAKYKYVFPKYGEDRKTVVGHEWTAEGKAKLYDFIQEYGMRQGLANMRARQMAKDNPELGAEEIFSRSALADVADDGDLAVLDRVLLRRAELQAVPGYAGNAVLSGIELSYSVRRNGSVIASVRAAPAFSPTDAQADWDKLPMAVQIDLFDLITRQTGLAGTDSRLLELVSPSFVSAATAAYKEALRDASVDADMEAAIPGTKHSRQTALDHALYSYFTGLAAEENKKFSRWNGLQSGLKFPDRVVRDKFGKVSEAESSKLYAAYPTSLAYAEPAAAPGRKAAVKEAAPETPRYPLSRLLESGKVPLVAEFLRRHNATPAAEASEATELDAARALHKLVAGVKGLDIAGGIGQSLALKQLKAHAETLKKEPPAQPETGTPGPTAALTTARYAVSSQSQRDADDRYYDNQKAEKAEFKKEYVASWREFADAFDAVLSDDTQTFEARKRILRGMIAAERRFDRRPGVRPEAQPNAVLKDKLEYLINHIEDEHAEPVAPAAPAAPVQGTFDFGETATLATDNPVVKQLESAFTRLGFSFLDARASDVYGALQVASRVIVDPKNEVAHISQAATALSYLAFPRIVGAERDVKSRMELENILRSELFDRYEEAGGTVPASTFARVWAEMRRIVRDLAHWFQTKKADVESLLDSVLSGDLETAFGRDVLVPPAGTEQVDLQEQMDRSPGAKAILASLIESGIAFELSGSVAYAPQIPVFRKKGATAHDLDLVFHPDNSYGAFAYLLQEFPNAEMIYAFPSGRGGYAAGLAIPPAGMKIASVIDKPGYRKAGVDSPRITRGFDVVDAAGNVVGRFRLESLYSGKTTETWEGEKAVIVDIIPDFRVHKDGAPARTTPLHVGEATLALPISSHEAGMEKKLELLRIKDLKDLGRSAWALGSASVAPGAAQALTQTARSNQSGESRRPPGATPSTAALINDSPDGLEAEFKMSPDLARLHNHRVREVGLNKASGSAAELWLRMLRAAAEKSDRLREFSVPLEHVEAAEAAYYSGDFAKAIEQSELALMRLHQNEVMDVKAEFRDELDRVAIGEWRKPTAALVAAQQAETDKGLDGLTAAARPARGYWVSKTTNLSDPAAIDNQPYSESNRAGRIAYAQTWRNPPSPGLVAEVTKQLSDSGFVVRNNQSLPGQTATLRPAWAVFEGDRNAIVQAAADHLVRHSLNEARAGSLAPALSRAVQRNELPLLGPGKDYEGRPLADLVADELVRRMHGSRSLFLHGRNPVSVLVAELAHEIERGHLGDLIRRGELAVKNGYPVLKYRAEPRRIVPDARTDAPAMATFAEVVAASPALAKHKAVFSSAFSAYQVMNRATDLYLHDKLGYDDAMAAVAAAAYSGEFLDTMPADEIAATAALVTSYLPLGGTRAALLRVSGAAGRHYLLFDAMNELNVAYRDAQEHGDWVDRILIGVQGLEGMYWDKTVKNPPNPDGTPSENGAFDPKKRIKLTLEEARSAEDFALLVRNLIQYRHLWEDEANPAASAAWRKEKAVRVAFTPRYEGDAPVRNKRGKLVVEEDTVTLGELFDSVMKSAWRAKMLGEAGREESHLDPFRWAREVAQKFDQDHHIVNTKFAWVFGGQEFIPYRHNYFPLTRASHDKAGPLDQLVGNRFSALQRVADVELSRLNADPGLDAALKTDRKAAASKLTDGQLALILELMGEGTAEMESHRREDGYDMDSWTAKRAADWIVRRLAGRISQDMREALENSETAPNEAIEAYELSAELKRDMATIAHLRRLTLRTHMTEFAPAELERTSGANDYEAYLHSKELYGDRRELWYRPNSYSFMDSRRQYVKETYAAAVNKAVLGGYLTITDPGGNPSTMALPTDGMDLDRSIVRREDWIQAAKIQSKAAKLEGEDAFTEADASLADKALVEKLQRVYMKAKDRLGGHDRSTLSTPKTPSISEWTTFDPVSDKLLKHMVQVPFTETNEFWRAMLHAVQWTKHMSIGLSAFFYVALGESSISASGVSRNIVVDFLTDPKFRRQMLDGIKEFKRAREHYNPMVAARMRVMAEAGLEVGKTAATDKPITAVERDIERMTEAVRETRGDRAADIFHAVMAGSDNPSAWARLWPGISGKRWSDAMFSWFSAIKEWQTEQIMIQQAAKEGTLASSALLVPHEYRRRTAQYVNDTLGGQNFSQFIWATPSAMAALNLTLFAPNWTISAFLSSGLGLLTQRMSIPGLGVPAGGAPAPGQVPMIAASLVSMWVIVMQALPLALQSMAYAIGQAAGGDDDNEGDTPFPWQNEPGREDYIDMTPLARLMPWYKGDPTGKRRVYIQFAKQVHETGVLNPMGTRGWINEPYKQLMRKLSLPAKIVLEQMTGNSPGSDWDLEFKGKGILGALHSGEPGLKGLWTSRAGYVARKFIPISIGQLLENPETFPGMFIAPTSKGASQSKLVDAMAQTLATYASARDMKTIKQVPRARRRLDSLIPELMLAARRNGYDDQKLLDTARGQVLSGLYKEMWNALDRDDGPGMNQAAAAIFRVGGTLKGLRSSIGNRERTYGVELTPEQMQAAEDAMNWAMLGSE